MILAEIASGGGDIVHQLFFLLIIIICCGLIWFVGKWCIEKMAMPGFVMMFWTGLFLLIGLVVALNFLLGLAGHPLFHY